MFPSATGRRTVHLIGQADGERDALSTLLGTLEITLEVHASPADRSGHRPEPCDALLWLVNGADADGDLDGLLGEIGAGTPVVLLGRSPPLGVVVRALKAGAVDVLNTPVEIGELRRVLESAFGCADRERQERARMRALEERLERLTERERTVFQGLIHGRLNKEIGAGMGITERTVKSHRAGVLRKLEAGSVAGLVRLATTLEFARRQRLDRMAMASSQMLGKADPPAALSA
jgi:two-component system, LuxR family, response regulator FixJ